MELSSKIKAMKFMRRKEDAEERLKMEAQQKELTRQTHWRLVPSTALSKSKFRVEYDPSLGGAVPAPAAVAAGGRHSYKNFNPETEKQSEEAQRRRTAMTRERAQQEEKTISDLEMAKAIGGSTRETAVGGGVPSASSLKRPRE